MTPIRSFFRIQNRNIFQNNIGIRCFGINIVGSTNGD